MKIGVLALQGAFAKHIEALGLLGIEALAVREAKDLLLIDGLILPGGESTVMSRLLDRRGLREAIYSFGVEKPLFGTCAGLIMLSHAVDCPKVCPLQLINISVQRNAYGSQVDSFEDELTLAWSNKPFPAFFIRAPKIIGIHDSRIEVLATHQKEPVLVRSGHILAATFHPELTSSLEVHRYFINFCIR